MTRSLALLAIVMTVGLAVRSFAPDGAPWGSGAAFAFGLLLICAVHTGHTVHQLGLPHLTGFLLCGALVGPDGLNLVTTAMLDDLGLARGVSVGLIALLAGSHLDLRKLWGELRSTGVLAACALGMALVLLWAVFFLLLPLFPGVAGLTLPQRAVVALLGANVLCALSPTVVMGIVSETKAAGALASASLSMVVVADLVLALSFPLVDALVPYFFESGPSSGGFSAVISHLGVSILAGLGLGGALALYLRRIGRRVGLFVFAALFVMAHAGEAFGVDPLLAGLTAGLLLENATPVGAHELMAHTESAKLPTLALFFSVVGARLHLHEFASVAGWALLVAATRAGGFVLGTRLAGRLAPVDPYLAKWLPFGLFPQAGVAVALSNLVAESHPGWGRPLAAVMIGSVVVNELAGPVALRWAFTRTGEARDGDAASVAASPEGQEAMSSAGASGA